MPGFLTNLVDNMVLDLVFGAKQWSAPRTLWAGLSLRKAFKEGAIAEPSGGGYARVAITNMPSSWAVVSLSQRTNAFDVSFPVPTSDWGLILSFFLADQEHGGKVLVSCDLTEPYPALAVPGAHGPILAKGALLIARG